MGTRMQLLWVVLCMFNYVENRILRIPQGNTQLSTPSPATANVSTEYVSKVAHNCGALFPIQLNETDFRCHTETILIPGHEEAAFCSNNSQGNLQVLFCEDDADCLSYGNHLRCGGAICSAAINGNYTNSRLHIGVCTGAEYETSKGVSFVVIGLAVLGIFVGVALLGMLLKYFEGSSCHKAQHTTAAETGLLEQDDTPLTEPSSTKPLVIRRSQVDLTADVELPPPYDVVMADSNA